MRLALFKYFPTSPVCVKNEAEAQITVALRVSHWVEVEFPPLTETTSDETWARIAKVDKDIEEKRKAHKAEMNALDERRRAAARAELSELGV